MKQRTGPLADIRIIDLTQYLAGPFCTMLLADLGADVIKVEPPGGDPSRQMGPLPPDTNGCDYGGYFASVNRNKRSVVLDLKNEGDREALLRLVDGADALVENLRAGAMDRMGLGYEKLRERKPMLVYAAIRGFGDHRTGESPYINRPCFDVVSQSMGGLVSFTGPVGGPAYRTGAAIGDIYPGSLAALGVVSAIHNARATGQGQFVDVAMYDAILALSEEITYQYSMRGRVQRPSGNNHQTLVPYGIFPTQDGAVAIAAQTDHHWQLLCGIIGQPELGGDERTRNNRARLKNAAFVRTLVSDWTSGRPTREVVAALDGKVPTGPVNNGQDIFEDSHPRIREMLVETPMPGDNPPVVLAGSPIKFTQTPSGIYARAPRLGEHNAELLAKASVPRPKS
ncbi:MAG TPA: CoA transferase [Candidatus Binataceae bacterium]|jgi:crotonobetainyl-CoA:carnitine CoA-transferase CaiB-like acyl-CoA transferase|nr:CoA transferase [Candidatus Binataceae bacterium]